MSRNCYGNFQEWSSIPVLWTWVYLSTRKLKMDLHVGSMVRSCFTSCARYEQFASPSVTMLHELSSIHSLSVTMNLSLGLTTAFPYWSSVADRSSSANSQRCSTSVLRVPRFHQIRILFETIFTGCQQHNGRNSRHCCSLRTPSATGHLYTCKNSVFLSL